MPTICTSTRTCRPRVNYTSRTSTVEFAQQSQEDKCSNEIQRGRERSVKHLCVNHLIFTKSSNNIFLLRSPMMDFAQPILYLKNEVTEIYSSSCSF